MRKAVNFRATVFAAAGLTAGILLSYFSVTENLAGKVATGVTAAILFTVFTFLSSAKFKSTGKILCFLFFALFFAIGAFSFNKLAKDYTAASLGGNILTVRGSVGEISALDDYTEIVLTDIKVSGAVNGESRYKAGVYLYGENALRLGDEIEFTAALTDKDLIYNGKFAASSLARGVKYFAEVNADEITLLSRSPDIFQKCNLYIFDTLKKGLKIDEFATAYAILTGNSDYMTEENLTAYRVAGVAHIFAVSGLHIGFLATAIYFILNKLKLNRYAAFFITLFAAAFYSGVCGFSASSLRAVIMFFFLNFARLTGLKYDGISSVFAAALLILIIWPAELFCVGFLLSFSVVITVIVLFNPLTRLLKFLPKKLAAALSVSFLA